MHGIHCSPNGDALCKKALFPGARHFFSTNIRVVAMPAAPRSALELLQGGTLPAATRGADAASRASRGLAALKQVKYGDLRQASQVSAVRMSIEVLLRHVSVPKHICVLDLLLVAYILLRACDDRSTITNVVGGLANLPLLEAAWEAANPFYATQVGFLTFRAAMTALNLHPVLKVGNPFRDDPFTEVLHRYWQCTQTLLSVEQSLVNVLFILATRSKLHALWRGYSERCAAVTAVAECAEGATTDGSPGAQTLTHLGPCCGMDAAAETQYQLLVARPLESAEGFGGLRLCIVMDVWRVGKKGGQKALVARGKVQMPLVSAVRVQLLTPKNVADQTRCFSCSYPGCHNFMHFCSVVPDVIRSCSPPSPPSQPRSYSPTFTLDAHDGSLLYEIPAKEFEAKTTANELIIQISDTAMKAFKVVADAKIPLEDGKKKAGENKKNHVIFLTADDLKNSMAGRANMQNYVQAMRRDWELMFGPLTDDKGILQFSATSKQPDMPCSVFKV